MYIYIRQFKTWCGVPHVLCSFCTRGPRAVSAATQNDLAKTIKMMRKTVKWLSRVVNYLSERTRVSLDCAEESERRACKGGIWKCQHRTLWKICIHRLNLFIGHSKSGRYYPKDLPSKLFPSGNIDEEGVGDLMRIDTTVQIIWMWKRSVSQLNFSVYSRGTTLTQFAGQRMEIPNRLQQELFHWLMMLWCVNQENNQPVQRPNLFRKTWIQSRWQSESQAHQFAFTAMHKIWCQNLLERVSSS